MEGRAVTERPNSRWLRLARVGVLVCALVLACVAAAQAAWTVTPASNPTNAVAVASLGAPASATLALGTPGCTVARVTWPAVASATSYKVEKSINGGTTWTTAAASTGNVLTWTDPATAQGGGSRTYRVAPLIAGTAWVGATATTVTMTCSATINLTSSNPTNQVNLVWNPIGAEHGYDIERRIGATGAWSYLELDRVGTTYVDTTEFTQGENVSYRVRPVSAAGVRSATYSNTTTIAQWNGPGLGLQSTITITTDYSTGYCANVAVKNTSGVVRNAWEVTLSLATFPVNGTPTSVSNATQVSLVGTTWKVKGSGGNVNIAAGATVTWSYCANRGAPPVAEPTVTIAVDNAWGSGFCATGTVTTTSPAPITWQVTALAADYPIWPGTVTSLSNATTVSFSPTQWVLKGAGWNDTVVAGQTRTFQFCGNY